MRTLGGARGWFVTLFVAGAVLAAGTGPAQAQYATVVAYEIREAVNCNPGTDTSPLCVLSPAQGFGTRLADAIITGGEPFQAGGAWSPSGEFSGSITITASSVLSQVDWTGPVHGSFALQRSSDNRVVTGRLSGQLDLSEAVSGTPPMPLAPISGTWHGTKGTLKENGTFSGVFLIPFECELPDGTPGACYLDPTTYKPVPVQPNEFIFPEPTPDDPNPLPMPLVKLLVTLNN